MRNVQEKLERIQQLLYEVRREVSEAAISKAMSDRERLGLDGRLSIEAAQEQQAAVGRTTRGPGV